MTRLDMVLALTAKGCAVFPLKANTKDGQHLASWAREATTDAATIRGWDRRWPGANWAIHLGRSGLLVIDLDRHPNAPDGVAAWARLCDEHPGLDTETARAFTPSGGQHRYYRVPAGCDVSTMRSSLAPGIDVKKGVGYVLCPPSVVLGRPYRWAPGGHVAMLPNRAQEMTRRPKVHTYALSQAPITAPTAYLERAIAAECASVERAANGSRNHTLNRSAFSLGTLCGAPWAGLDQADASSALLGAALSVGLPEREAENTITSGLQAGIARPRSAPSGGAR